MGEAFITRRGGSGGSGGLELTVCGGTTRPTKVTHNTIWINTDVEITSHVLSSTEPASPVEGMVWVTIGAFGTVKMASPVGGDWITVYPLSAKQYVSGAWVKKEAKSYRDGEWVDWWNGDLYTGGNEYVTITGGWKAVNGDGLKVTFNSDKITVGTSGDTSGYEAAVYTKNKIDVTNFNTLTAVFSSIAFPASYSGQGVYVGLTNINTDSCPTDKLVASKQHTKTGSVTLSVDISKVSGPYYPVIVADVATCNITKIYFS